MGGRTRASQHHGREIRCDTPSAPAPRRFSRSTPCETSSAAAAPRHTRRPSRRDAVAPTAQNDGLRRSRRPAERAARWRGARRGPPSCQLEPRSRSAMAGSAITASPSQFGAKTSRRRLIACADSALMWYGSTDWMSAIRPAPISSDPLLPFVMPVYNERTTVAAAVWSRAGRPVRSHPIVVDRGDTAMKIALLQINPTVGDLAGNARLIADAPRRRARAGRRSRRHAGTGAGRLSAARSAAQRRLRRAELGCSSTRSRASSRTARRCSSVCPSRTRPTKGARSSTARRCCAAAASSSASARRCCRPTTCSTRTATSSRSTAPQVLDVGGHARRHQHLRGHLERPRLLEAPPLPPRPGRGARPRRRDGDRQPVGVAVHRRQARAARGDAEQHGRASTACRSCT